VIEDPLRVVRKDPPLLIAILSVSVLCCSGGAASLSLFEAFEAVLTVRDAGQDVACLSHQVFDVACGLDGRGPRGSRHSHFHASEAYASIPSFFFS
jgi:hypothetical protein